MSGLATRIDTQEFRRDRVGLVDMTLLALQRGIYWHHPMALKDMKHFWDIMDEVI